MSETDFVRGTNETYAPAQLAVALLHLAEVQRELNDLRIGFADEWKSSKALGLALLELTGLEADIRPLRADTALVNAAVGRRGRADEDAATIPALDLLMFALRKRFERRYEGWTPTMGKNRLLGSVAGLPEVSGGGAGDPQPQPRPQPGPAGSLTRYPAPASGRRIRVGVLDTRLVVTSGLEGRFLASDGTIAELGEEPHPAMLGHAAFVAGLILDRAPAAELEVRWVLGDNSASASAWEVATAMVGFMRSGVDILNTSLGCATDDGKAPLVLARAVEQLSPDVVLIAAAGNHADPENSPNALPVDAAIWPAAFHDVVAVGAHDQNGDRARFSPNLPWVELSAPGVDQQSGYLTGLVTLPVAGKSQRFSGWARWNGTSFATANASGEIARHAARTERSARAVLDDLMDVANPLKSEVRRFSYRRTS